jgi:hypothetical protein
MVRRKHPRGSLHRRDRGTHEQIYAGDDVVDYAFVRTIGRWLSAAVDRADRC